MAFLDNSGDIILDAVLTDAGRRRLAKGDGSFRIAKFAMADDEINYGLYDPDHANGSAFYDLEIMQTPILESVTNINAAMHSRLLSIPNTNILYLPVLKLNNFLGAQQFDNGAGVDNTYILAVDQATEGVDSVFSNVGVSNDHCFVDDSGNPLVNQVGSGVLGGWGTKNNPNYIQVDQGLDTIEISNSDGLAADLIETAYVFQCDHRLISVAHPVNGARQIPNFVDNNNVATTYLGGSGLSINTNLTHATSGLPGGAFITGIGPGENSTIAGPRGSRLTFKLRASLALSTGTHLFTKLGGVFIQPSAGSREFYYIDTTVRVQGVTTGYRIDIPVRCVKFKSN